MRRAWYDGSGNCWRLIDRGGHAGCTHVDLRAGDAERLGDLRHLRGLCALSGFRRRRHLEGSDRCWVSWSWGGERN